MSNDDWNSPESPNPFSSPQSDSSMAARPSVEGAGFVCDGSGFDAVKKGWSIFSEQFLFLVGAVIVLIIVRTPADNLDKVVAVMGLRLDPLTVIGISWVYGLFVAYPTSMGFSWLLLRAARKEQLDVGNLFGAFQRNYLHCLLGGFLKTLILILGFLLLFIPGIYFAIKLSFVEYLLVDKKMSAPEAITKSWEMTSGKELEILVLGVLSFLLFIGGFLLCIVGVFLAVIWVQASFAVFYYTVSLRYQEMFRSEPRPESDNPFAY
ncbi:hypothetical protein GC197_05140 [bacterium]|nr:hypothetical protein [bacterium]